MFAAANSRSLYSTFPETVICTPSSWLPLTNMLLRRFCGMSE